MFMMAGNFSSTGRGFGKTMSTAILTPSRIVK
jgi:hypothetical protein